MFEVFDKLTDAKIDKVYTDVNRVKRPTIDISKVVAETFEREKEVGKDYKISVSCMVKRGHGNSSPIFLLSEQGGMDVMSANKFKARALCVANPHGHPIKPLYFVYNPNPNGKHAPIMIQHGSLVTLGHANIKRAIVHMFVVESAHTPEQKSNFGNVILKFVGTYFEERNGNKVKDDSLQDEKYQKLLSATYRKLTSANCKYSLFTAKVGTRSYRQKTDPQSLIDLIGSKTIDEVMDKPTVDVIENESIETVDGFVNALDDLTGCYVDRGQTLSANQGTHRDFKINDFPFGTGIQLKVFVDKAEGKATIFFKSLNREGKLVASPNIPTPYTKVTIPYTTELGDLFGGMYLENFGDTSEIAAFDLAYRNNCLPLKPFHPNMILSDQEEIVEDVKEVEVS